METANTSLEEAHMGWGEDIFPKLSWWKQHKVSGARVMVVGCGALGNEVAKDLALFGVGHLWLVDFDRVEYSNLMRSVLFTHGTRGMEGTETRRVVPGTDKAGRGGTASAHNAGGGLGNRS